MSPLIKNGPIKHAKLKTARRGRNVLKQDSNKEETECRLRAQAFGVTSSEDATA